MSYFDELFLALNKFTVGFLLVVDVLDSELWRDLAEDVIHPETSSVRFRFDEWEAEEEVADDGGGDAKDAVMPFFFIPWMLWAIPSFDYGFSEVGGKVGVVDDRESTSFSPRAEWSLEIRFSFYSIVTTSDSMDLAWDFIRMAHIEAAVSLWFKQISVSFRLVESDSSLTSTSWDATAAIFVWKSKNELRIVIAASCYFN